ncbi:potassium transporter [Candidatus Epulonipiscium fishelsonii]|nr:potassium transporter [Epulopiscium sp. SCG-B05WGA-EpuloA1]
MDILILVLRLVLAIVIANVAAKLISKLKLPGVLGYLLAGMVLGPYALNLLSVELTTANWYHTFSRLLELSIGVLFAKDLVFKKMKAYGKQVISITFFESIGTFVVVTLFFAIVFSFMGVPLYVAVIFGGIALATAPVPALSIINEYKTKGDMTKILLPIAVMDDVIALSVFFTINAFIMSMGSAATTSPIVTVLLNTVLPIILGIILGFVALAIYKKMKSEESYRIITIAIIISAYVIAYITDNFILPAPALNYMLLGMALFTTITNKGSEEMMEKISSSVAPIIAIGFTVMILNLAAPLDYHLIFGAGVLTFVYIISRGLGKYFGTYLGAKTSNASDNIRKYLGLTLLPHSGVSLLFTGMAGASLSTFDAPSATIVQGTIAAAAVINEIFAVILAKKGFELAGEINPIDNDTPAEAINC